MCTQPAAHHSHQREALQYRASRGALAESSQCSVRLTDRLGLEQPLSSSASSQERGA
jgi:hypothetical protein